MNLSEFFLYVVLPLTTAVYWFLKKQFSYFEEKNIPFVKPSWIYGNLSGVNKSAHMSELLTKVYEECKEKDIVAGFYSSMSKIFVPTDLEVIKNITIKDFNIFPDRGVYSNEEDDPLTGHLFAIGGEKWRFLRHKLSPVFTSGKIKSMYHTISDKGDNFVEAIEAESCSGSIEMKEISMRFTIDVISSCAFGLEANTLNHEHPEVLDVMRQSDEDLRSIPYFLFLNAFPTLAKFLKLRQFRKSIDDFYVDVVGGNITNREENNIVRNDFMNMLVQLKNKGSIDGETSTDSRKLTLKECVAQGFVFMFAGADTSSTTISYAITELSLHPEIQDKLRTEILDVSKGGELTYDNLHEMNYLNKVVNETLRKYPPAFLTMRKASVDYQIPGSKHVIPKGSQIFIPNIAIHYDKRYWKDPETFDPKRFTAEESAKRPNMAFMPFGEGPRNCIGMRFALVNVKFGIATVIKNFKAELDATKTKLPLALEPSLAVLSPIGGYWVKFEKI